MKLLYNLTVNVYLDRYEEEVNTKLDCYLWHTLSTFEVLRIKELLNQRVKDETDKKDSK